MIATRSHLVDKHGATLVRHAQPSARSAELQVMHNSIPLAHREWRRGKCVDKVKTRRAVPEFDSPIHVPRYNQLEGTVGCLLLDNRAATGQRPRSPTRRRLLPDPREGHERPSWAVVVHAGTRYLARVRTVVSKR